MARIRKITVQIGSETRSFETGTSNIARITDNSREFENSFFIQYLIYSDIEDKLMIAIEGNCGVLVEYYN